VGRFRALPLTRAVRLDHFSFSRPDDGLKRYSKDSPEYQRITTIFAKQLSNTVLNPDQLEHLIQLLCEFEEIFADEIVNSHETALLNLKLTLSKVKGQ
jgi:hypothetical protein